MKKKKPDTQFEINQSYEVVPKAPEPSEGGNIFSTFGKMFVRLYRRACKFFFPANIKCIFCDRDLKRVQLIEICEHCEESLPYIKPDHRCERCGAPVTGEAKFCMNCKNDERAFDQGRSVFIYEDVIKTKIAGFKYHNKPYLGRTFGQLMARYLKDLSWDIDLIVPVPLSKQRFKWRGFNQAEILAQVISDVSGIPINTETLIKIRDTESQAHLSLRERKMNLQGSFEIKDRYPIKGKNILLIDDVMTTGSTAHACAQTLKKARAERVFVLTFAHGIYKIPTENITEVDVKAVESA